IRDKLVTGVQTCALPISYRLYLERLEHEKNHVEDMAALHLRTIEALALAIEAKDHTTHEHLKRVRVYAVEIAKQLKVSEEELEEIGRASCRERVEVWGEA